MPGRLFCSLKGAGNWLPTLRILGGQMRLERHSRIPALVRIASMVLALSWLVSGLAVAESLATPHTITTIASTVPANGDINPYGIFVVPNTVGSLVKGNLLISNFNAASNQQGTGTTIMQISPSGNVSQFAQIDASSLPNTDGTSATAQAGCLLVLDPLGNVSETIYGMLINGPWDMAVLDHSNGNGGGTASLLDR